MNFSKLKLNKLAESTAQAYFDAEGRNSKATGMTGSANKALTKQQSRPDRTGNIRALQSQGNSQRSGQVTKGTPIAGTPTPRSGGYDRKFAEEHLRELRQEKELFKRLREHRSDWRTELIESAAPIDKEVHPYVDVMPHADHNLRTLKKQMAGEVVDKVGKDLKQEEYKKLPKTKMGMKAGKKTLSGIGHALRTGTDGVGSIEDQKRGQQADKKGRQADKIHNVAASHSPTKSKLKEIKNKLKGMTKQEVQVDEAAPLAAVAAPLVGKLAGGLAAKGATAGAAKAGGGIAKAASSKLGKAAIQMGSNKVGDSVERRMSEEIEELDEAKKKCKSGYTYDKKKKKCVKKKKKSSSSKKSSPTYVYVGRPYYGGGHHHHHHHGDGGSNGGDGADGGDGGESNGGGGDAGGGGE